MDAGTDSKEGRTGRISGESRGTDGSSSGTGKLNREKYKTLRDYYRAEITPVAISVGMTYEEFWKSNPKILNTYISAHIIVLEEQDKINWYHGIYVQSAIGSCFNKDSKYPKKPFLHGMWENSKLTEDEIAEKEMLAQIASMRAWSEKEKENGLKEAFE